MKVGIYCMLFIVIVSACSSMHLPVSADAVSSKWITKPLQINFQARNAFPSNGGFVSLSSGYYYLKVNGDTVNFLLPFYGRAYQADFSGNGGYEVKDGLVKSINYGIKEKKKSKSVLISMDVLKEGKHYSLKLEFFDEGSAYLDITSMDRDKMSYDGSLVETGADR